MKKVFLKVAIVAIALVTMSVAANAQEKGDMAAGGNLVLGAGDSFTNFGIGAKFQYNVTDPLRLEGSFTYFLKKNNLAMWDLSANAHWLFPVADNLTVYPLAGLGILNCESSYGSYSVSTSDVAFNIGGGIDCKLTDQLIFNAELKYKINDTFDRLLISAGLAYKF